MSSDERTPSLRSLGIPETTHGESGSWTDVVPDDVWIGVDQGPVPSIAVIRGRTPPAAVVAGIDEVAIEVEAVAARKGRKPKIVSTVATTIPT